MKKNLNKVAIIDYKMANMYSVKNACSVVGLDSFITSDYRDLFEAKAAILPGVGAFRSAMENLNRFKLINAIRNFIDSGKPFMGVCLGMQLLFSESEEFISSRGLNILKGKVIKFSNNNHSVKVPHIGWNRILRNENKKIFWDNTPLSNIPNGQFMYFVHSYYVKPEDENIILSHTNYGGIEYCSSLKKDNIFATQFHPEKSGKFGIEIYKNWKNLIN